MIVSTYNKIESCSQSVVDVSWCAVINFNNKAKTKNREVPCFLLSKDKSVHKD